MATDGPTPEPCDPEIFQHGEPVVLLDGPSNAVEHFVLAVAARSKARVDWHYSGGIAQVLHLGNAESYARVIAAIKEQPVGLPPRILRLYAPGESGLYRAGVTRAPEGAIAGFYNPLSGTTDYIVRPPGEEEKGEVHDVGQE